MGKFWAPPASHTQSTTTAISIHINITKKKKVKKMVRGGVRIDFLQMTVFLKLFFVVFGLNIRNG